MIFTKSDVGSEIFAISTGNNARHNKDGFVSFKVVAVGRVYVSLSRVDSNGGLYGAEKYHPESGVTQKSINSGFSNAGFKFFRTLDELMRHKSVMEMRSSISVKLSYSALHKLSDSQIERIHSILSE